MKYLTAGACALFLLFVVSRAVHVPFTYDEAAAYIRYIDSSVPSTFDTNLLSLFNFEVATNHFLNTALTKLSCALVGTREVALRLPNLFGYTLYLGFAVLILRRLSNPLIAFGGLLLLNLNPYVLDFFALSRGYGLSLGLMVGSLYFLLRFLERRTADRIEVVDLSRALAFACGAVMANFALLNVYLSILAVVMVAAALFNRRAATATQGKAFDSREGSLAQGRAFPWLPLTAAVFIPLVLSQDIALSESLYEPVVVRLIGLDDHALGRARVVRLDIHGRESLLRRDLQGAGWSSNGRPHFRGLRVELARGEAERLSRIECVIGTRAFSFDPRLTDAWAMRDVGEMRLVESAPSLSLRRSRVPTYRSVINWAGDRVYFGRLVIASAFAIGTLAVCALLLRFLGRFAVRTRVMKQQEWRALSSSFLWVAALAGPPLYLLKRNSELYFGGTRGLVADTFTSIIENSFYVRIYGAQTSIVFGCILVILAICFVLLVQANRRSHLSTLVPTMSLLGILLLVSFSIEAQRLFFGTVYLVGRTALFYIPLFVLFFTFVCDGLARAGRLARLVSVSLVIAAVSVAAFHFSQTANLKYVHDWKDDASTKAMIEDVRPFAAGGHVTLGVGSSYAPVAFFYARRAAPLPIEVVVVPTTRPVDFLYVEDHGVHSGDIVSRYPFTRTALVRVNR
jgi:hypothetical protein